MMSSAMRTAAETRRLLIAIFFISSVSCDFDFDAFVTDEYPYQGVPVYHSRESQGVSYQQIPIGSHYQPSAESFEREPGPRFESRESSYYSRNSGRFGHAPTNPFMGITKQNPHTYNGRDRLEYGYIRNPSAGTTGRKTIHNYVLKQSGPFSEDQYQLPDSSYEGNYGGPASKIISTLQSQVHNVRDRIEYGHIANPYAGYTGQRTMYNDVLKQSEPVSEDRYQFSDYSGEGPGNKRITALQSQIHSGRDILEYGHIPNHPAGTTGQNKIYEDVQKQSEPVSEGRYQHYDSSDVEHYDDPASKIFPVLQSQIHNDRDRLEYGHIPNPSTGTTGQTAMYNDVLDQSEPVSEDRYQLPDPSNEGPNGNPERKGVSVLQSLIANFMGQSPAFNYAPKKTRDYFDFLRDSYPLPKGFQAPLSEYAYVIVGAGSAGSALASRLTEDKPRATVLLLEAGRPEVLLTDVPALAPYFQRTDYTWKYIMERQPGVCLGMEDQRCFWPRGKAVGGTSVINYMIYTRGRPQEWDRIAADGNYGWSYNEVLRYYIKSEKCNLRKYKNLPYRGRDGKVSVEDVPFRTKLSAAFLEAGRELGHPTVDYNAPDSFGFGYMQANTINGHRHSSAKAYLHPHKQRKNLHILSETVVTKVLIDPKTKRAYGVEYVRNRLKYTVKATREVILSAGPIASPQLLMLSGVGPREHLQSLNIPVIKHLNVGRTLYDHITFPGVIFRLNTTGVSLQEGKLTEVKNFSPAASQWFQYGDGPLSSPGGVEGIGYIKTPGSDEPELVPDIELISLAGSIASDAGGGGAEGIRRGMRITDDVFYSAFGPLFGNDTWSAFPMLLHPKSKGYLELRDTNPFSFPKMYGNYLTDRRDVEKFIAAIRHIIALGETEAFQRLGATLHPADIPMCRQYRFNTDAYWECGVRTMTSTLHHQISTCKMGPSTDKDAVVDPELRVHGIKSLRVVDTSIIPRTTSAHTNAPGMMIGEKAADLIKQTWSKQNEHDRGF